MRGLEELNGRWDTRDPLYEHFKEHFLDVLIDWTIEHHIPEPHYGAELAQDVLYFIEQGYLKFNDGVWTFEYHTPSGE